MIQGAFHEICCTQKYHNSFCISVNTVLKYMYLKKKINIYFELQPLVQCLECQKLAFISEFIIIILKIF